MILRIATLNTEQNHKAWDKRRDLIAAQLCELAPAMIALNELHIPEQTGRWLKQAALARCGLNYTLLQLAKAGNDGLVQGEGLLTSIAPAETASRDFRSHDCVAMVARFELGHRVIDVYITHLIAVRVEESAREHQVGDLLHWIGSRNDADGIIVCGDFNATMDQPSIRLMTAASFQSTQQAPTAFSPLRTPDGTPTHPEWPRFDRCIDYIWVKGAVKIVTSGLCFNQPAADDINLWPSDHIGVWADLEIL